jgi:hypothetical protein
MGFFDGDRVLPTAPEEAPQPEWIGPPDGVVGGVVAAQLVLFSSPELVLAATHFAVFPNGLTFEIQAAWRQPGLRRELHPFGFEHEPGSEALRVGVLFPDGRRARSTAPFPDEDGPSPARPLLIARGGGGGERSWRQDYWVWPRIPAGDLGIVIEWPARAIAETHVALASEALAEARERILVLWPDLPVSAPPREASSPCPAADPLE